MSRFLVRHTINTSVLIQHQLTGEPLGHLVNLTTEGMMILSPTAIPTHTTLPLQLTLPTPILGTDTIALIGECLWCKQNPDLNYWAGFQFSSATEHAIQQLDRLIDTFGE